MWNPWKGTGERKTKFAVGIHQILQQIHLCLLHINFYNILNYSLTKIDINDPKKIDDQNVFCFEFLLKLSWVL